MRVERFYEPWETIAHMKKKWLVIGLGLMVCGYGTVLADEDVSQALRERVERLRETGQLTVDGVSLAAVGLIPEIYERRGFEAAWTRQKQIDALVQAVEDSYAQGLDHGGGVLASELTIKVPIGIQLLRIYLAKTQVVAEPSEGVGQQQVDIRTTRGGNAFTTGD